MINLRGRAVPVIDLAIRFVKGVTTIARRTCVIIVHINDPADGDEGGQDIGILVDAVNKVEVFATGDVEPAPAFGAGIRTDFISGMAKRDGDFIIVLDIDRILSVSELAELSRAASVS